MTFVGKVIIVVQVVLTFVFMAFAGAVYTAQTNWKAEYETLQQAAAQQKTELDNTIQSLNDQITLEKKNALDAQNLAAQKQGELADAQDRAEQLEKQLETARTEAENQRALAEIADAEAEERRKEAVTQRKVNKTLHEALDKLVSQIRTMEDEIFSKNLDARRITKKHEEVLEELALVQTFLNKQGLTFDPTELDKKDTPPPEVEGLVLNTRKQRSSGETYVEISIGSDDGIAKGHSLYVFRAEGQGKYLGKITIVYVTPDRAVGTVVQKAKNGVIQRGDNVTTKL